MRFQGVMAMVLVQDIERAGRFYRDILGFTVQEEEEEWVLFHEGVGLQVSPESLPDWNVNINAVMVTLFVEDIQAIFAELTQQGVAFFLPPTSAGSAKVATFRDSEGNLVQLMQS